MFSRRGHCLYCTVSQIKYEPDCYTQISLTQTVSGPIAIIRLGISTLENAREATWY